MRFFWGGLMVAVSIGSGLCADGFAEEFRTFDPKHWSIANYTFTHPHFDTDWSDKQVAINNGLTLSLSPQKGRKNRYLGGSIRRNDATGYGRYEVTMQPMRGAGVVTGFFTYTGAHYGTRHDEIDIEFLGKNTRQIHLALFVDGQLWNKFIDLDFDAADAPRAYAFEWGQGYVRWFVGDQMIYERRATDGPIPFVAGRLFANIWAADPTIKSWSGLTAKGTQGRAHVRSIGFTPHPIGAGRNF